jgi:hypothetical protein
VVGIVTDGGVGPSTRHRLRGWALVIRRSLRVELGGSCHRSRGWALVVHRLLRVVLVGGRHRSRGWALVSFVEGGAGGQPSSFEGVGGRRPLSFEGGGCDEGVSARPPSFVVGGRRRWCMVGPHRHWCVVGPPVWMVATPHVTPTETM